jgi:hypothetical protein
VVECPSTEIDADVYQKWADSFYMEELQNDIQYNLQYQKHMLKLELTEARKHYLNEEFFALGQDMEEIVARLTTPRPKWMADFEDKPHHDKHHEDDHHKKPEDHHKKPEDHHKKPVKPEEPKESFTASEQVDLSNYYI